MKQFIVILSTVSSQDEADTISQALVNQKLAACVNVVPSVISYYRWAGQAQIGKELMLVIKTCEDNFKDIQRVIKANHSYELPEIIALPILVADDDYLKWVADSSSGESQD